MELLQEGFQPGVDQEGVQELGKLWGELFFVVWIEIFKRILKMQQGEKKPKATFEQLQAEQRRSEEGGGSIPCQGAAAAQICGHTGAATGPGCA